ncbi:MAG: LysM peptidoglycan-binding domain-containing protein [Ilumatobacter sp.]|nr:LysM peptidoglycan-binding domain-containing protein [Ilumatobacter sp.]
MRNTGWALLPGALLILAGCSGGSDAASTAASTSAPSTSAPATTDAPTTTVTTVAPTTTEPAPICVVTVQPGDSLGAIVAGLDGITMDDLLAENRMSETDIIHPGEQYDVCPGNDVDDVTGTSRLAPPPAHVEVQQAELNGLFAGTSLFELGIDGDSGPLTRQAICAARMLLGLPESTAHLPEGSEEEATIFAATSDSFTIPAGAATWSSKWILINETCQVIVTGEGADRIVDIFPTSTGTPDYPTHNVQALDAYRFDPALDNEGWHDSTNFPSEVDNPLNGNMYKPIYFNGGQAIHGAGYIPPNPRSKGCARTFPHHQDRIIAWLGIDDIVEPVWNAGAIGATVSVVGEYRDL